MRRHFILGFIAIALLAVANTVCALAAIGSSAVNLSRLDLGYM
ncbi:MAG TPA: hypothetical protein VED46_18295 [Alphaproteobacteria bacterium]|nr:hypothetical protein [Alphaproteobacteria bacterium]